LQFAQPCGNPPICNGPNELLAGLPIPADEEKKGAEGVAKLFVAKLGAEKLGVAKFCPAKLGVAKFGTATF